MSKRIPRGDEALICPFHHKPMLEVCHICPMWTQIRGSNPNTGAEVDDWNCAVAWLPLLLIENAQQVRQGAAATESFRNEVVKAHENTVSMTMSGSGFPVMAAFASNSAPRLIEAK